MGAEAISASAVAGAPIQARVLGAFELVVRGRPLERSTWQRESAAQLVKLLLVTPGHRLSRELAAETMWPGADPDSGRANLRKAIHFARRSLGVDGVLASDGDLICLDMRLVELDLDRLTRAFAALEQHALLRPLSGAGRPTRMPEADPGAEVAAALATALELGAQPLLPDDPYEDWLAARREHLQARWQATALAAAREAVASERRAAAHAILAQVLERDPTDEEAHRLAIDLYAVEGRHHAVRRQFEACRRALADGLDATPSAETEASYRRAERAARGQRAIPPAARVVGRQHELGKIEPVTERAAAGRFGAVAIHGPAGIGKSHLLEAVCDQARSAGWRELAWQALESTRSIAFAPFALRLGDEVTPTDLEAWDEPARSGLAAIVPRLGGVTRLAFADPSALRVAVGLALVRLARLAPLLIAIDDVAVLDDASLQLLATLPTVLATAPVLLVATYRDETPLTDGVEALIDGLRRSGSLEIRLGPLARPDIEPLVVGHLGGEAVAAPLGEALFGESEGNPLFCIELAREAAASGAMRLERGSWVAVAGKPLAAAPETVRHLVAARSQALPAAARELLRVAAELGQPEFGYDTLAAVLPELRGELITTLDAVLASGILVERGAGYAFGHPLYRVAVESSAGNARRGHTHLAIAHALSGMGSEATPSEVVGAAVDALDAIAVAEHALRAYELGVHDAAVMAVGFGFVAGARARRLFDRSGATALLTRALGVWERLSSSVAGEMAASDAFANLAELQMAEGDDPAAVAAFRRALEAARNPDELATAYERYSWLPQRHGDFPAILALCQEGQARLPVDAVGPRAVLRQRIAYCLMRLGRFDEAIAELEAAIPVLERNPSAYLGGAIDLLGCTSMFVGRMADGLPLLQRALAIAQERRDTLAEVSVRAHLAPMLTLAGRAAEARPHLARALELADQTGEWYGGSVTAWLAADVEDALGNLAAARELRLREIALLQRIGGNPHNEALARAHLAHIARLLGEPEAEAREADRARALAAVDPDPVYAKRIEAALSVANWSDVQHN